MIDEKFARLRTYDSNIERYHRLLKTELSELERQIHRKASKRREIGDGEAGQRYGGLYPSWTNASRALREDCP
jgi:hypothetical protein